jgi:hypothetical protein
VPASPEPSPEHELVAARWPPRKRHLVVSRWKENVSWTFRFATGDGSPNGAWDVSIIGKDPGSQAVLVRAARTGRLPLSVATERVNTGDEAVPYLRFILAHYDAMPAVTAFLHGCPFNHQPYMLDFLECVREDWTGSGYFPLNKNYFSSWGAKNSFLPFEPMRIALNEKMRAAGVAFELAPVVKNSFHCCAQFLVSAAAVRARPREFYEVLLDVALTRVLGADGVTPDRKFTAVFFEFVWHSVFGRPLEEPFLEPEDYCGPGLQPFSAACCDAHPLIRKQLSDEEKHDWRDMYENETARRRTRRRARSSWRPLLCSASSRRASAGSASRPRARSCGARRCRRWTRCCTRCRPRQAAAGGCWPSAR